MYLSFFGLSEKPFAITPDPRYLYLSERHAEALAHLLYGIGEAGGFVQLTGEVGTGKTTIVRSLLGQIPKNTEIALILNPRITAPEFMLSICEELGIGLPDRAEGSLKDLVDILNHYLLRAHADGRRVVLLVDEAQNLAPAVLEQVRLLTNLETPTQKLLQIILIGQPELRELLGRNELRQLAQRITGRYHLDPLSREESAAYVLHRLRVAGATTDIFTGGALAEVYRHSRGIPRLINVICDRSLLGAYTQDRHRVTAGIVRESASEVFGRRVAPAWLPWAAGVAGAVLLAVGAFGLWQSGVFSRGGEAAAAAADAVPAMAQNAGAATPAPAEPAPVADPLVSLSSLFGDEGAASAPQAAASRLVSLWGGAWRPNGGELCQQAAASGLDCVTQKGSFAQLRLHDRPALLTVADDAGRTHDIVLIGIEGERARIEANGQPAEVSIADLAKYWFGDYTVLWRPPSLPVKALTVGTSGADVAWLRRSLTALAAQGQSAAPPSDSDRFDEALAVLVEEFQRERRLEVDGIAGRLTQLAVDSAIPAPGTPRLLAIPGRGA